MSRSAGVQGPFDGLWLVMVAERLGFESLAERLGYPGAGAILLVFSLAFFDRTVLDLVAFLQTGRYEALVNPVILLLVPLWPLGIWVTLRLQKRANDLVEDLPESHPLVVQEREPDLDRRFLALLGVPVESASSGGSPQFLTARLQSVVLVLAVGYHFFSMVVFGIELEYLVTYWGTAVSVVRFGLMMPLFYAAGSQIASLLVAIHVLLPLWLSERGRIDFSDAHGFGGLRPVGNLVKVSTLYYLVAVALIAVFLVPNQGISGANLYPDATIFLGMVLAVVLFFGPAYWLHRHMRSAKEIRIDHIAADIRSRGPTDDEAMFPETRADSQSVVGEYTHGYIQLSQVRSMHEYPIDISMVQEFLFVLLLPYVAHLSSIYVFEHLHL